MPAAAFPQESLLFSSRMQNSYLEFLQVSKLRHISFRSTHRLISNVLIPSHHSPSSDVWRNNVYHLRSTAIPFLGDLKANESLETSLREWITLAPTEARAGLQRIALLFGVQVLLS